MNSGDQRDMNSERVTMLKEDFDNLQRELVKVAVATAAETLTQEAIRKAVETAKAVAAEAFKEAVRQYQESRSLCDHSGAMQLGGNALENALVSDSFLPSYDGQIGNRVWHPQKWPSPENGGISQELFKGMLQSDVDWDLTMHKITFTGVDVQHGSSAGFAIHVKDQHPLPCYVVAVLSLCSLPEPSKTQKDRKYNSEAHVGLIINRAQKVLRDSGPSRQKMLAGVTNLQNIQWFLVERRSEDDLEGSHFTYMKSSESDEVRESLISILMTTLPVADVKIHGVTLEYYSFLGSGASGCVHACKWSGRDVAAKFYREDFSADAEMSFLNLLEQKDVQGVPRVVGASDDRKVLVMSPVGKRLHKSISELVREKLADIIDTLRKAHELGIVHRDVKLANILLADHSFILIDWGFACFGEDPESFAGCLYTSSSSILKQCCAGRFLLKFSCTDDLVSLVKSLYLLNHRDFEMRLCAINLEGRCLKEHAKDVDEEWQSKLSRAKFWQEAIGMAEHSDYDGLKRWIVDWALNFCP